MATKTVHHNGKQIAIQTISPGCTCRVDGKVPGVTSKPNWQQGILIASYDEKDAFFPEIIPVNNGRAVYRDEFYVGADYSQQLRNDTVHRDKDGNVVEWNY